MASKKAVEAVVSPQLFPLVLYKRILRLHYGLPPPIRQMGDEYVKAEFRRHKDAPPQYLDPFFKEWMNYCKVLASQLSSAGIVKKRSIGMDLKPELLDSFADEQIRQLYDLKIEADSLKKSS